MIEHPDHTGASSNPLAPWNQPDPDPVMCDVCDHEPGEGEAQDGDPCSQTWDDLDARPQRFGVPCEGVYRSTRCTECNSLSCRCDP